jgi:fused signal recognition particle receptor
MNWLYLLLIVVPLGLAGFYFLRNKKPKSSVNILAPKQDAKASPVQERSQVTLQNPWWSALSKTRAKFFFNKEFRGEMNALKESLEEACLVSDLGVSNTQELLNNLNWSEIESSPQGIRLEQAKTQLSLGLRPWISQSASETESLDWLLKHKKSPEPVVIWFVGVNGVGKTTSISKLATELKNKGHSVLLGAGDTFRAAAAEQLETWAERIQIPIVKGQPGADSSAVLFDAIQSAKAKNIDFVLCDSAGRLHNQTQLMESLSKVHRIMAKALPGAPHEVLLVLDANTGQNMLTQAEQFQNAVGVTGLILTKLDGTAKGGAVVAVARKTQLPIRRLGLGEKVEDFVSFNPDQFSKALVGLE